MISESNHAAYLRLEAACKAFIFALDNLNTAEVAIRLKELREATAAVAASE